MARYRVTKTETTTLESEAWIEVASADDAREMLDDGGNDLEWHVVYSDADTNIEVDEQPTNPRVKHDDDGQEYSDPRDYRDGKE